MNWRLILPSIAIGLMLGTAIALWLSRPDVERYRKVIKELNSEIQSKQAELEFLWQSLEDYVSKDIEYKQQIELLTEQANEYKADRKYWFKQHQRIADSVQALIIDEQQRYWTKRYPPRQLTIDPGDNRPGAGR